MDKFEAIARKYCALRGLDPDDRIAHSHPEGLAVMLYSPRWKLLAEHAKDLDFWLQAFRTKDDER